MSAEKECKPGPSCPNGVYVYDFEKKTWRLEEKLPFKENGYYVIYFDNSSCPACRKFDQEWFSFVDSLDPPRPTLIVVLCDWFAKLCASEYAKKLFEVFDVHISPTVFFMIREDGKITRMFKHEGLLDKGKLVFLHRAFKEFVKEDAPQQPSR